MKMNKNVHGFLLLTALVMLLTSCSNMISVEKRKYRKGFYIEHASKPSSTNSNSAPVVAETKRADSPQLLNQGKKDSLPKENSCVQENVKQNFNRKKIVVPEKIKRKTILTNSKEKIKKAAPSFPVKSKRQIPVKNSQPDEAAGVVVFFVVAASIALLICLGILAVYMVLWGGITMALLMMAIGIIVIVVADIFIIRAVLRNL
jgi:hypothetical protein